MKKINENLTPEELFVLKDKGTERPFTGKFDSFLKMESINAKTVMQSYLDQTPNMMLGVDGQVFLKQPMKKP